MFDFSLKKYRFDFFFYRTDSVLYRFDFVSLLFGFKKKKNFVSVFCLCIFFPFSVLQLYSKDIFFLHWSVFVFVWN